MMRWIFVLLCLLAFPALAQVQPGSGITIVTDGVNTVNGAFKMVFSGATVSQSASGTVTVTLSGGGSVSVTAANGCTVITPSPGTGTFTIGSSVVDSTKSASYQIAAGDMCGQVNFNGSNLTATIPAISSTVLASGMTVQINNYNATPLTLSSTPTINGFTGTSIPQNGGIVCTSNGTSLDCIGVGTALPTPLVSGSSTGNTLTGPRQYFVCTTTCTVTPPVPPATGSAYEFCVLNDVGVTTVITMGAIGTSVRYGKTDQSAYGTAGTGTFISGGAAGDKICLLSKDATHYNTASFNGTWTAN